MDTLCFNLSNAKLIKKEKAKFYRMDEDYVKLAQVGYANLSKDYFDVVSMIRKEASSSEISTSVVNDILDKVMGMFVRDKIRTGIKELNNFKISENGYSEEAIQEAYDAQVEAIREYAEYVGNFYGTPKRYVDAAMEEGKDVIQCHDRAAETLAHAEAVG